VIEIKSHECQTKLTIFILDKLRKSRKNRKVNLKKSCLERKTGLGRIIRVEILPVFYGDDCESTYVE
jgi:hypothetical protein